MYIKKLFMRHFGKYHNQELELRKGINLIYGPNEAGKTTIRDFIVAMFYGVERMRGIAARTDEYTRREPLEGGRYAGSMELNLEGKSYIIDRVFQKEQKSLTVCAKDSGRELELEGENLQGVLIDMDKNGYKNTLCISSSGAAYKQELQEEFRQYLMNMNETHAGNLNIKDALAFLNQQKKTLNRKGLENELQSVGQSLKEISLPEDLGKIDARRHTLEQKLLESQNNASASDKKQKAADIKSQMDPQLKQIMNFIKIFLGFGAFALVLVLIFILPISTYYKGWLCVIAVAISIYIWVHWKLKGLKKKTEETKQTPEQILEYSRQLTELQIQENELLQEYARQQDLHQRYEEIKKEISEVDWKLEALTLAQNRIQELSENMYDEYSPGISRRVSEMVSSITGGNYTDVKLDEQLNIKVRKDGRYLGTEFLSTGTLEQIYLAVRLAVATEMSSAGMPLLLDDIFGAYDDERLEAVLQCLATYPAEQVIIFTAGDRLADALDRTDIDYNYIEC